MNPYASVLPQHAPQPGPIGGRLKQRTSSVGIEDWSDRRPWAEPDRGQGQGQAFFATALDHGTAVRGTGAVPAVDMGHRSSEATGRNGVDVGHQSSEAPGRESLTLGGRTESGPLRHEYLPRPAGPSHAHMAPHFSLPHPLEARTTYDFGHHGQQAAYNNPPPPSHVNGSGHPPYEQQSTYNYHAQSQGHGHNQSSHEQHGHAPTSYYHSHQNGLQEWYGNSASQAQQAPAASHYVHTTPGDRYNGSIYPRRLPLKQASPPPFSMPILQAEISQLATAPPQQPPPHSPRMPRDLSHILHHSDEPRAGDLPTEARQSHFGVTSYNPVRAYQYPLNNSSASFSGQPALSDPVHTRAETTGPASPSSAGMASGAPGFAASPVHPPVTSAYGHGYGHHSHDRSQLPSISAAPVPVVTQAPPTYAHPNYSAASPSDNYQLSPTDSHRTSREREYPDHDQQHGVGDGSGYWVVAAPGASSGEEDSPPQHTSDQNGYSHHPPRTPDQNGYHHSQMEQWVDNSVEASRHEMEPAAHVKPRPAKISAPRGKGPKAEKKKRGKFTEEKRQGTAQTRKIGACIRCKCQRIRCNPKDPDKPDGYCQSCLEVNTQSKKMIHSPVCRRYRLTEMMLSRQGGLNMTSRWNGTMMKDVGDRVDDVVRIVELKIFYSHHPRQVDLYHHPIRLEVHRFRPREGDVLHRRWKTRDNLPMTTEMTPFALSDINKTAAELGDFISEHVFEAMRVAVRESDVIVRETYDVAIKYFQSLKPGDERHTFLSHLFRLWFAMRLTTGSAYISGPDKLDMVPETRPDYPLGDRISLPRMITAQFDSILTTKFLKPGTAQVTRFLEKSLKQNSAKNFFVLYVAIFIILHEISVATKDRGRYARDNQLAGRFSLPEMVGEQHFGAINLLAHWQYYKTEMDPLSTEPWKMHKSRMSELNEEQKAFVFRWWHWMRQPGVMESLCPDGEREQKAQWEEPLYFVCQMYKPDWKESSYFVDK